MQDLYKALPDIVLLPHLVVTLLYLHTMSLLVFDSSDQSSALPAFVPLRTIVPARCRPSLPRSRANSSSYGNSSVQLLPHPPVSSSHTSFWLRSTLTSCRLPLTAGTFLSSCLGVPTSCFRVLSPRSTVFFESSSPDHGLPSGMGSLQLWHFLQRLIVCALPSTSTKMPAMS